jgi:hypothetical protein
LAVAPIRLAGGRSIAKVTRYQRTPSTLSMVVRAITTVPTTPTRITSASPWVQGSLGE